MKKYSFILFFILVSVVAKAQLCWRISGGGLSEPSYIFGTHHIAPLSIMDSIQGLEAAFSSVSQVCGEVDASTMNSPEIAASVQSIMMLPADTTLSSLFSKFEYDTVASVIRKYMGVDLSLMDRLRPSVVSSQLSVILTMQANKEFNLQQQIDSWFQSEALNNGKIVLGFETVEEQIKILCHGQSLSRQAQLLYCCAIHIDETVELTKKMTEAYLLQDLNGLFELLNCSSDDICDSTEDEIDMLIYHRNSNWVKVMPEIMKKPTFFVVGAGHLPGDKGVLNLLKAKGYLVEPVK